MEGLLQFSLLSNLKTGNPIVDVLISGAILSIFTWLISHYSTLLERIKDVWSRIFRKNVKSEISFYGEELMNAGNTARNYSAGFCAVLHLISRSDIPEVTSYEEVRTAKKTFQDDYHVYRMNGQREKESDDKIMLKPSSNLTRPFRLAPKIFCQVSTAVTNSDDRRNPTRVKTTSARLFSHELNIADLRKFAEEMIDGYETHMREEVEKKQFYFVTKMQPPTDDGMGMRGMAGMSGESSELGYDQFEFRTSRSFNNIFYSQKDEVKRRLDFFLNNRDWYAERGVPYTLGFLFFGPPGTGKTSTIKAIANYTKRHIVEVSLGRIKTYRDLQKVFHETTFCDKFIPHHKLIYVLEDIDCLDEVVHTRSGEVNKEFVKPEVAKKSPFPGNKAISAGDESESEEEEKPKKRTADDVEEKFKELTKKANSDPLTLSHLLNILDGLLETPGRILIITSNHPEKLDEALVRPGRVDMKVEFGNSTVEDTVQVLEMFYKDKFPLFERAYLANNKFSPAQVYNICFQCKTMAAAIDRLKHDKPGNELAKSMPDIPQIRMKKH